MEASEASAARERLTTELELHGHLTDPRVEEAILNVPRHMFVPDELVEEAYDDKPMPVGYGQTISAPHMVAMMTTALQLEPGNNVLEIGTGMGYQAAVLAQVVGPEGRVTSIEYLPELARLARQNLANAGADVAVETGDGADGWPAAAPYDAILITCAVPAIPEALVDQLSDGGHLVAPVGVTQCELTVYRKAHEELLEDGLGACLFVNAQGRLGRGNADDLRPSQ